MPDNPRTGAADETRFERELPELLGGAFPDEAAPPELRARVLARVRAQQQPGVRTPERRRLVARMALALVVLVLAAIGLATLAPRHVEAELFEDMEASLSSVKSAHFTTWELEAGKRRNRTHEIWFQAGLWRLERGEDTQIFRDGTLWIYHHQRRSWTRENRKSPFHVAPTGFSPAAMVHSSLRAGYQQSVHFLERGRWGGREVHLFALQGGYERERLVLAVNPKTQLPVGWTIQARDGEQWIDRSITEAEFGSVLPDELFRLPPSAKDAKLRKPQRP
ncbi:MAG: LolA family protein [Armatimonadota bacterium]